MTDVSHIPQILGLVSIFGCGVHKCFWLSAFWAYGDLFWSMSLSLWDEAYIYR